MVAHHCPFCGSMTDRPVIFAAMKQRIFTYIWDNPGSTQEQIMMAVYGHRRPISSNAMSVHISKIRKALTKTAYQMITIPVRREGFHGRVVGYKITYKPKVESNGTTILPTVLP